MSILEDRLQRRGANNLDFLRFLAAALVIVHHSIALLGYRWNPLGNLTGYFSLGQLGVDIFFCMSGLLVTRSWLSAPRPAAFLAKRALRILPGLWTVILLGAWVAGPLLSHLPAREYFANPNTSAYLRGLWIFPVRYVLPGVFPNNPSHAFNGSLWTLPLETFAYAAVLAAGWLGGLNRRRFGWVLTVVGVWTVDHFMLSWGRVVSTPDSVHLLAGDECNLYFLLGAAAYVYRDSLPLNGRLAFLAAALWLGTLSTGWLGYAASFLSITYLLLYAAVSPLPGLGSWGRYGDLSYGMYIYAFPIQQMLIERFGYRHLSIGGLATLSLLGTMAVAFVSWHTVEKPCLRLSKRLLGYKAPGRPTAGDLLLAADTALPKLSKLPAVP